MVLQEIIDAVESFATPPQREYQTYRGADLQSESAYTREIASRLHLSSQTRRIWTAKANHRFIRGANPLKSYKSNFFHQHSEIDISWADGLDSEIPEALLEIKLRSANRPSTDHYFILTETAAVAADYWHSQSQERPVRAYCVFIAGVNERNRTDWLSILASRNQMSLEINPTLAFPNAQPNPAFTPYWIDRQTGLIRPNFRSAMNKIMSGTTSTHYAGFFMTPGRLTVGIRMTEHICENQHWILQYEITSVALTDTDVPLNQWWP